MALNQSCCQSVEEQAGLQRQEGKHRVICLSVLPLVSRFVKYTGYGNAAGLLAARGLMAGGREEGEYSEDEDTDTEEYKEAKPKYRTLLPLCSTLTPTHPSHSSIPVFVCLRDTSLVFHVQCSFFVI